MLENKFSREQVDQGALRDRGWPLVVAMLVTHVDDLCLGDRTKVRGMNKILKAFVLNDDKAKSRHSRSCGKEAEQLLKFSIRFSCEPATE